MKRSEMSFLNPQQDEKEIITVPIGGKPLNEIIADGEIAPSITPLDIIDLNEYLRLKKDKMSDIDKSFVEWVKTELVPSSDDDFLAEFEKEIKALPEDKKLKPKKADKKA